MNTEKLYKQVLAGVRNACLILVVSVQWMGSLQANNTAAIKDTLTRQKLPVDSMLRVLVTANDDPAKVDLLNRISDFYLYYLPAQSPRYALDALELAKRIGYKNGIADAYINLGFAKYRNDEYPQEIQFIEKALKIYTETGNRIGIGNSHIHLGNAYYALGNFMLATEHAMIAIDIFERLNYRKRLGSAYYVLGIINFEFGNNLPTAIKNMEDALVVQNEVKDTREMALTLCFLGNMYQKAGNEQKALELYLQSQEAGHKSFNRNAESYSLRFLGAYYFDKKDYRKALDFFNRSLALDNETENYFGTARDLNDIGKIFFIEKNYAKAIDYNTQALATAEKIGDIYSMVSIYEDLSKIHEALNDPRTSLHYQRLYNAIKDSVFNGQESAKITAMQTRSEYDKKLIEQQKENEKQKALAEEKTKRQQLFLFFMIGLAIAVAVIAVIIFRALRVTQQKNLIIEKQKETLEEKSKIIGEKNKDITDSINYAKRIQEAILPVKETSRHLFPKSFLLFRPRDVVSGDFYWFAEKNGQKIIAAVDCTGHGVPGAFMSMIGNAFLNEIVNERGITKPSEILSELRHNVIKALKQTGAEGEARDGMDISLITYTPTLNGAGELEYAGANNPLWIIRSDSPFEGGAPRAGDVELIEMKADKRPIGFFRGEGLPFTNQKIELRKGDLIYIFTDGYADQFGGPKGKKFKYLQLKELLVTVCDQAMHEQEAILQTKFDSWKGDLEQVDDVLFIGIRV